MEDIKVSVDKGIQKIIFNRSKKKNAFNRSMYDRIAATLNSAAVDDSIIMTVLTGEGDFFSSGNDITDYLDDFYGNLSVDDFYNRGKSAVKRIENFVSAFIDFPKMLVAVVNGPAIGIGATILGLCDLVFASDMAYFLTPFTKLGLSAEGCSSVTFPQIMGSRKAIEMLYFSHKMTVKEAKEYNFVNDVIPHAKLGDVWSKLHKFAALPSGSLLCNKSLVRGINRKELHQANIAECNMLEERFQSEEFMKGVQNFVMRSSKL